MWDDVNSLRNLPPNAEFVLYMNDKPRIFKDLRFPGSIISGELPAGSGTPKHWKNHVPFPSHFYTFKTKDADIPLFESKQPVVFFRGRFSENAWKRFKTHKFQCENTPRFKLSLATSYPDDEDVLDIKLTGFANVQEPLVTDIKESLKRDYNITMGKFVDSASVQSRYSLSVSGNDWAGATTMKSLLSGSCMFFVNDNSTDYEGYTRNLGEIYFPLMKSGEDFFMVEYDTMGAMVSYSTITKSSPDFMSGK